MIDLGFDTLDRMAAAAYDRNMELSWRFVLPISARSAEELAKLDHSWERQPEQLRSHWREIVKTAMQEFELAMAIV